MKPICIYSINIPSDNFFCASIIHIATNKRISCSVLDGDSSNTDVLIRLIRKCLFLGYENSIYDDIILNYIEHNKDINTKELFELSEILIDFKNREVSPWRNEDIAFYIKKYTDCIDLSEISIVKTPSLNEYPRRRILRHELDTLLSFGIDRSEGILEVYNQFLQSQNYGFRKNYKKIPDSEDMLINYLFGRVGLVDIEI